MPTLTPGPADRELQRLIELFLKAETDIINEISRLRSLGLVDYHAEAALERVQAILRKLENDCWTYVPRMIETQFYVKHPEARKPLEVPETPEKHIAAYQNARVLTGEQTDIVQRLTMNLMGQIVEGNLTAAATLQTALLGRIEPDVFRHVGLEQSAAMQATGRGVYKALPDFVTALRREGVTAFVDKAGRHWSLHTYGSMVLRTTSRQAEALAVLTENPDHDLYQISKHGTTCKLCAPLEGRVYSRSGRDPDFPPLAAAFGKMDPGGPDDLTNSWLNIHPNCLHQLIRWTPMGRSEKELQEIKDFSSFTKNPPTRDPRTKKQIEAYRKKEEARARFLRDYRQWERYRAAIPDSTPKTFATFQKHKRAGDDKYKAWRNAYRKSNRLANPEKSDILGDTKLTGIPITDEAIQRVPLVRPSGWSQEQAVRLQEAHRELLQAVRDKPVGTEAGAVYTMDMRLVEQKIGESAGQQIDMPRCDEPHILIHNHPSGMIFSPGDVNSFGLRVDTTVLTAIGNNGIVYVLQKLESYDTAGFAMAFGKDCVEKLHSAKTAIEAADIMQEFLLGVQKYGVRFISGTA